jgi:hypothetical protein
MREVRGELDKLPQSLSDNPQGKLLAVLEQFHSELDERTNMQSRQNSCVKSLRSEYLQEYDELSSQLEETRTLFKTKAKGENDTDDESENSSTSSLSHKSNRTRVHKFSGNEPSPLYS